MKARLKLTWKLTAAAALILIAVIALDEYVDSLVLLLLGLVTVWITFAFMLERPLGELVAGTKQLAAHKLDFRFEQKRGDEIGVLQESFNTMAATIQASQDELRDAKEYLEGMVENSADIIITVNSEGLIETLNRGGEELLGYRREEIIGEQIESLYVDPRERRAAAARLEDTNDLKNWETRLLTKDGRVLNVLLTLSRLRDAGGDCIGTIGISKDITQEKGLQDELRDAKQYLEGMVENSADIIITVNSEGLIETFNRGGEEALGYLRNEVIGTRIESLFVDPAERHAAAARLEGTDDVTNYETRLLAKDGQVRNVLLTLSRLFDAEGNSIGTIGISKDITREKSLQRELTQSQKFAAIGEAVTGIQHAIKNMLDALNGGAYLVRVGMKKDNSERIEEGLAMVKEGIERIGALSHNMLNFAREWKAELQEVDLSALIEKICELNRQAAVDHGVALRHEVSESFPPVPCDPKLIHMAVTDILVNAIDACNEKPYADGQSPEIVLGSYLEEGGDFAVIEVRDNGCGMTEETKRNIFTPFFSTKSFLGTGLGLALTARIIRVHGGDVLVDSEPDRGTTFRVRIPKNAPGDSY